MSATHQLKAYLVKDDDAFTSYKDVLRSDISVDEVDLVSPLDGVFLSKETSPRKPSWIRFVQPAVQTEIDRLWTQTSAAVLLLRCCGRIFAFTFGYGRTILRPDCYERDFGLRVVLNCVNPDQIRSADMRRIEEATLLTRRQASRATEFATFGLDARQDLLRGITGIPSDLSFASRISGAESLTFSMSIDVRALPEKCAELLSLYGSTKYKERFGFIDHLRLERDPSRVADLEKRLLSELNDGVTVRMHLAPPEPLDWENVQGFTYSSTSAAKVYPDLSIDDAVSECNPSNGLTIPYLRRKHVGVRYREAAHSVDEYTLYSCLVYEHETDDRLYILSGGDWHQVDKTWADGVRAAVSALPRSSLPLPLSQPGEHEACYNERAASQNGWALLDRKTVMLSSPYDRIELCDIMTRQRQLVHVKRKMQSATLSHLFAQGAVSAELLVQSDEFRIKCHDMLSELGDDWNDCVPNEWLNPKEYEVVYAIIGNSTKSWPRHLPFFSQLNLRNTADRLRALGYSVSLKLIAVDE